MAYEFFVRRDGRNRRFTGGKSRFLQEADGGKGVTSAAAELCGIALRQSRSRKVLNAADPAQERPLVFLWNMSDNWPVDSILSFFCGVALYKSGGGDRARCVHIPQQKSRPPVSGLPVWLPQ